MLKDILENFASKQLQKFEEASMYKRSITPQKNIALV